MTVAVQPHIHLPLGKAVLGVEMFDLVSNKRLASFHREKSRCSFFEQIPHGPFELTFRLDWGDLIDGEPTLDLDVTKTCDDGTRKRLRPAKVSTHHTQLTAFIPGSTKPRIYDLEFEGLHVRLVARKTFAIGVGLSVYIVDPAEKQAE